MKLAEDLRRSVLQSAVEGKLTGGSREGWRFVRLGDIGRWQSGATPSKTRPEFYGGNIPWLVTGDLNDDYIDDKDITHRITETALAETSVKMNPRGSVLIAMYGATIGRTGILNVDATTNQACCACLPYEGVYNRYLFRVLQALKQTFINMAAGGAQPNISKEKITRTTIPLPPIDEQRRIVSRLDAILPLIAELESAENELAALERRFPGDMRDSLLQAAIKGRLTGSNTDNWRYVRLGDVGNFVRGHGIKKSDTTETGKPCIRYGQLYTTFKTSFSEAVSFVPDAIFQKSIKVHKNDILMALTGENKIDIALAVAYMGDDEIAMGGDMTKFTYTADTINPMYLVYCLNSPYAISRKSQLATGNIIVHISNDKLASIIIPLPPIDEQHKIVTRLNELLPLCDTLEDNYA